MSKNDNLCLHFNNNEIFFLFERWQESSLFWLEHLFPHNQTSYGKSKCRTPALDSSQCSLFLFTRLLQHFFYALQLINLYIVECVYFIKHFILINSLKQSSSLVFGSWAAEENTKGLWETWSWLNKHTAGGDILMFNCSYGGCCFRVEKKSEYFYSSYQITAEQMYQKRCIRSERGIRMVS